MESTWTTLNLLSQFSNWINVLVFYAKFYKWRLLMNSLCQETRLAWNQNETIFENNIQKGKLTLVKD